MSHKSLKFKIAGVSPLVMHNGQLADPLNEFARAMRKVSGKRAKTDADHEELARLEWYGGLYLDGGRPCIPGFVFESALVTAARKSKKGKQAQAGIICPGNYVLSNGWHGTVEEMWTENKHRLTARVKMPTGASVMRTRPIFHDWEVEIEVMYDPSLLNESEVREIVQLTGESIGLCDWRPKFGRFEVVS